MTAPGPDMDARRGRSHPVPRALDALTEASLWLAMLALAGIFLAYNLEVVMRYFLGSPTRWSAEFVSYFLLVASFAALPYLTRQGGHVAVTVLLERLPARGQAAAAIAIAVLGAVICGWLAWIAAAETLRQAERGVRMMAAVPIPKAWVSGWIVWGLGLAALQFAALGMRGLRTGRTA